MAQKVAIVTGANTGLGFATTLELARRGAHVVMACRSKEKADRALGELQAEVPDASATVLPLDVSEDESIREFGRLFSERFDALDLLVNNAGIIGGALARSSAGYEMHLATNYLGVFALTGTLLRCFREDAPGRIVNVGSLAHRFSSLDFDDLNWERTRYNDWKAYARSKVALLTFTMELERRLRASGSRVVALAAHPGFAATEIALKSEFVLPDNAVGRWLMDKAEVIIPSASDAARPILHAATDESVRGGEYYGPSGFLEIRGKAGRARINPVVRDVEQGRKLWAVSEEMTGVAFLSDL